MDTPRIAVVFSIWLERAITMDPADNSRITAQELMSFARQQGIDLEPFHRESAFEKGQRFIFFWRKDELPATGPANEPLGTLHYNMQGAISELPSKLKDSAS